VYTRILFALCWNSHSADNFTRPAPPFYANSTRWTWTLDVPLLFLLSTLCLPSTGPVTSFHFFVSRGGYKKPVTGTRTVTRETFSVLTLHHTGPGSIRYSALCHWQTYQFNLLWGGGDEDYHTTVLQRYTVNSAVSDINVTPSITKRFFVTKLLHDFVTYCETEGSWSRRGLSVIGWANTFGYCAY